MELAHLHIGPVDVGDFIFATSGWFDRRSNVRDLVVVEIQACHSPVGGWAFGLLHNLRGSAVIIERDDAIALRILHMIAEHRRPQRAGSGAV